MKNPALLWAIHFQFNCKIYLIVQLSSLKLPMDSQCIQASSSKSISVSNVREDFHIYIARQSTTLTKMPKWCFVWQYEYGCLPLHIRIWILLQKKLVLHTLLGFMSVYCTCPYTIYLPQQVYIIIIHRNTAHILDIPCCHKHQ